MQKKLYRILGTSISFSLNYKVAYPTNTHAWLQYFRNVPEALY